MFISFVVAVAVISKNTKYILWALRYKYCIFSRRSLHWKGVPESEQRRKSIFWVAETLDIDFLFIDYECQYYLYRCVLLIMCSPLSVNGFCLM